MTRRLSNGKMYFMSLMRKSIIRVKSPTEPFYLITLREVNNMQEVYDLDINLNVAKKIFGKKGCTN